MTNPVNKVLNTLYNKVMEMPHKVLEIFNNFFGEERVDMQGFTSKTELIHSVLGMTIVDIFRYADIEYKLPLMGLNSNQKLVEVDFYTIPDKSAAIITEAILSDNFVNYNKIGKCGFILVHFPQTVVTNEHDRSTVVNHIYIKVPIGINGNEDGLFTMNRSEYTVAELYSNYMHSHASHIPKGDFKNFVSCCLGSGPLNYTQSILSIGFDEDRWNMFCLELSKYIEVESIAGRPYHFLERISINDTKMLNVDRLVVYFNDSCFSFSNSISQKYKVLIKKTVTEFLLYYLEHNNLTFSYRNGVYSLGMPYIEYLIHLSNSFIEYVNNKPELIGSRITNCNIIEDYVIRDGGIYQKSNSMESFIDTYKEYVGQEVCTFKGKPVTITISDLEAIGNNTGNEARIINLFLASSLLNRILRTINYRYGRNQENPDTTIGKVRYNI